MHEPPSTVSVSPLLYSQLWIRDQSVGAGLARDASEGSGEDSVGAAEERVRALRREVQAVKRAVRLREQEMGGPGQPG